MLPPAGPARLSADTSPGVPSSRRCLCCAVRKSPELGTRSPVPHVRMQFVTTPLPVSFCPFWRNWFIPIQNPHPRHLSVKIRHLDFGFETGGQACHPRPPESPGREHVKLVEQPALGRDTKPSSAHGRSTGGRARRALARAEAVGLQQHSGCPESREAWHPGRPGVGQCNHPRPPRPSSGTSTPAAAHELSCSQPHPRGARVCRCRVPGCGVCAGPSGAVDPAHWMARGLVCFRPTSLWTRCGPRVRPACRLLAVGVTLCASPAP